MGQIMKDDLKIDSPFEILTFGLKFMMVDEQERN